MHKKVSFDELANKVTEIDEAIIKRKKEREVEQLDLGDELTKMKKRIAQLENDVKTLQGG